jgi:predicted permease
MIFVETLVQDLRYGARMLWRNAGFTAVSILALAVGIGVNTAAFTAYKALVARPLDGRDPDTLVNVALRLKSGALSSRFSYPDYEAYRDQLRSFSGVIAFSVEELRLTDADGAAIQRREESGSLIGRLGLVRSTTNSEIASTFIVSENYFSVLGVKPIRGLAFDAMRASELAASPAVLISENFWQRRFDGDPAVLGKTIRLNGAAFTIIGITPADFTGTTIAVPNFWLPLSLYSHLHPESHRLNDRDDGCCRVFGRLAPGVSMAQAQAETMALASRLGPLHGSGSDLREEATAEVSPGSPLPEINFRLRWTIILITAAAGMVLVIACANAAGLQLARATTRQQELGMRLSLGASRPRLIRQLVTESALLGMLAGSLALPVTWSILHVAVTKAAEQLPAAFTLILPVRPDLGVLAYVLIVSMLAGVLFGLVPAMTSSRNALFSITRGMGTSIVHSRLRHGLIAAQVAVSLTLMIAGGLLIRSASQAISMDTGYDDERVLEVRLQFPDERTYTATRKSALVQDLRSRLAAVPGVTAVTSANAPAAGGAGRRAAVSLNGEQTSPRNNRATVYYKWVEANYFDTLGIPLLRGQGFSPRSERTEQTNGVIVSESAAQRLWPGQNPIGQSLRLGTDQQFHNQADLRPDGPAWQVIGIARDTRGAAIDGSDSQQIYVPLPSERRQDYPVLVRMHAAAAADAASLMRAIEPAIAAVDPNLTATMTTLQAMLRRTDAFLAASFSAAIATTISLFGLLLASIGIYSTVSYDVVLRTREVGIRMAIGAQPRHVTGLMLLGSLRPVGVGLILGVLLAIAASYLLRGVLYGIGAVDVLAFGGASLLFLTIALAASWLPSRRALRVDPLIALRHS